MWGGSDSARAHLFFHTACSELKFKREALLEAKKEEDVAPPHPHPPLLPLLQAPPTHTQAEQETKEETDPAHAQPNPPHPPTYPNPRPILQCQQRMFHAKI